MTGEQKHIFGAPCPDCGRVTHFDKREVCCDAGIKWRRRGVAGKPDELYLKCEHCGHEMVVEVDCEDYR